MTEQERRDFLAGRGWLVATAPVRSGDRSIFSMVEELAPRVHGRKPLYFIDLATGEWCLSGKPWQSWERGLWHELSSDEPDGRKVDRWFTERDLDWFDECIAAGFEIVVEPVRLGDGYKDRGTQEAVYQETSYLLMCVTKTIMGPHCRKFKLQDFIASGPAPAVQQAVQQTASKIAPPKPEPKIYQNPEPIAVMGNNKQRSLFA